MHSAAVKDQPDHSTTDAKNIVKCAIS